MPGRWDRRRPVGRDLRGAFRYARCKARSTEGCAVRARRGFSGLGGGEHVGQGHRGQGPVLDHRDDVVVHGGHRREVGVPDDDVPGLQVATCAASTYRRSTTHFKYRCPLRGRRSRRSRSCAARRVDRSSRSNSATTRVTMPLTVRQDSGGRHSGGRTERAWPRVGAGCHPRRSGRRSHARWFSGRARARAERDRGAARPLRGRRFPGIPGGDRQARMTPLADPALNRTQQRFPTHPRREGRGVGAEPPTGHFVR